jgi:PAS domain S-box-containing protein
MVWGTNLSYAHPESDWISTHTNDSLLPTDKYSHQVCHHISFASIESDFCARYVREPVRAKEPYSLISLSHAPPSYISFATPVSDFLGDNRVGNIHRSYTITEALAPSTEARVLTDATDCFRIQHVNEAWTRLCGYSKDESHGKTLGMLQGYSTDKKAVENLVLLLKEGRSVDAVLANYNKWGRKFHNHLTVNPVVCTQTQDITHFIGVLKEIDGENKNQYATNGN